MRKRNYKITVERVFYANLAEVLTNPSPRKTECMKVAIMQGRKEVKSFFIKEYPFECPSSFNDFLGRLYRLVDVDVSLVNAIKFLYITQNPREGDPSEIQNAPSLLSSSEFFCELSEFLHSVGFVMGLSHSSCIN